jgi:hypothetical protein
MCIFINQLSGEDLEELNNNMIIEGYNMELNNMLPCNTYVMRNEEKIMGFFHFIFEQNIPSLRHFFIKPEFRNLKNALCLINYYINLIKEFKYTIIIVNKKYLKKLIEYKFKKKPYAEDREYFSYLVEAK